VQNWSKLFVMPGNVIYIKLTSYSYVHICIFTGWHIRIWDLHTLCISGSWTLVETVSHYHCSGMARNVNWGTSPFPSLSPPFPLSSPPVPFSSFFHLPSLFAFLRDTTPKFWGLESAVSSPSGVSPAKIKLGAVIAFKYKILWQQF